jgi:hypothetical protein
MEGEIRSNGGAEQFEKKQLLVSLNIIFKLGETK